MAMRNKNIPNHIGIIMDGNGRWATRQSLPRNVGHKEGINAVDRTIKAALKLNIKILTFFAFSTENWKRSSEEINGIFKLVREFIKGKKDEYKSLGVKFISIGDITKFPEDLQHELDRIKTETKGNNSLIVNLALNYGGRADIVYAVNKLIDSGIKKVSEEDILNNLYTSGLPDPDFIIRTSGEMRISNFMLYQMAYSEFAFPKVLWPDFNERHLKKAIKVFSKRNRRFGGIT